MNNNSKNNSIRHQKAIGKNKATPQKSANNTDLNNKNNQKEAKIENFNTKTNKTTKTETIPIPIQKTENHSSKNQEYSPLIPSSRKAKKHKALSLLIFIGGTILFGVLATLLGGKMKDGYTKPPAYPPDKLFSIVWIVLYILIGIASYLAFKSVEENKKRKDDVIWYAVHLILNFLWPLFYFRLDMLIFSCCWLLVVLITAIIVTYRYYRANIVSGVIFTLYSLWLIFALYLSLGITMLNII